MVGAGDAGRNRQAKWGSNRRNEAHLVAIVRRQNLGLDGLLGASQAGNDGWRDLGAGGLDQNLFIASGRQAGHKQHVHVLDVGAARPLFGRLVPDAEELQGREVAPNEEVELPEEHGVMVVDGWVLGQLTQSLNTDRVLAFFSDALDRELNLRFVGVHHRLKHHRRSVLERGGTG